jgi:F-type H+-transporting ATPase subunit b
LSAAELEANTERRRLLDEARRAADALSVKRQQSLRSDARDLSRAIRERTQNEVFAIARKALTDLATTTLEERVCDVFVRRLRELEGLAKAGLAESLKTASEPALVRSAFALPAEQRAAIQRALDEIRGAEVRLRFEIAPELVAGIELAGDGQKVGWSISDYLASVQEGVVELLNKSAQPETGSS